MSVKIPVSYQSDIIADTSNIYVSKPLTGGLMTDLCRSSAWHAGFCSQNGASWVKGLPPQKDTAEDPSTPAFVPHAEFNTKGYETTDYLPIRLSPTSKRLEVSLLVQLSEFDASDEIAIYIFVPPDLTTPAGTFIINAQRITPRTKYTRGSFPSKVELYQPIRLYTSGGGQYPLGTEIDPWIDVSSFSDSVIVLGIYQKGVRVLGVTAQEIYSSEGN